MRCSCDLVVENMVFSTKSAVKSRYLYGKKRFDPYLASYAKINSRWIIDLCVETMKKVLEENMEKCLLS